MLAGHCRMPILHIHSEDPDGATKVEWNGIEHCGCLRCPPPARCWELLPLRFLAIQWDIASETETTKEREEEKKIYADISTARCTHITLFAAPHRRSGLCSPPQLVAVNTFLLAQEVKDTLSDRSSRPRRPRRRRRRRGGVEEDPSRLQSRVGNRAAPPAPAPVDCAAGWEQ